MKRRGINDENVVLPAVWKKEKVILYINFFNEKERKTNGGKEKKNKGKTKEKKGRETKKRKGKERKRPGSLRFPARLPAHKTSTSSQSHFVFPSKMADEMRFPKLVLFGDSITQVSKSIAINSLCSIA